MVADLSEHYRVRCLSAVFKRGNFRSRRLLERLGFVPASAEEQRGHGLEPDEALMVRELREELPRGRR